MKLHRYSDAEPSDLAANQSYLTSLGADHRDTQGTAKLLVELYEAWGKPSKAAEWRTKLAAASPTS